MKKKGINYSDELPRLLYTFFIGYQDEGAPSFQKFARSIGSTVAELESFRKRKQFDRAWRECIEIRRDYLTDRALTRRFDPSFVKFLLTEELEDGSGACDDNQLSIQLTVEE